jgi:hypothetical protein
MTFAKKLMQLIEIAEDGNYDAERDLEDMLFDNVEAIADLCEAAQNVNALSIQTDAHKQLRMALSKLEGL